MAVKPTSIPRWANVGALVTEPSAGKKDVGHVPEEEPPAQFENWLKNLYYQWTDYLDDFENNAHTYTVANAFNGATTFGAAGTATFAGITTLPVDTNARHGYREESFLPAVMHSSHFSFNQNAGYFETDGALATGGLSLALPPIRVGSDLSAIKFKARGGAGNDTALAWDLMGMSGAGALAVIAGESKPSAGYPGYMSTTWVDYTLDLETILGGTGQAIVTDQTLFLRFTTTAGVVAPAINIKNFSAVYIKP